MGKIFDSVYANYYTPQYNYIDVGETVEYGFRTGLTSIPASTAASHSIADLLNGYAMAGLTAVLQNPDGSAAVPSNVERPRDATSMDSTIANLILFANSSAIDLPTEENPVVSGELEPYFDLSVPLVRTADSQNADAMSYFASASGKEPLTEVPETYGKTLHYEITYNGEYTGTNASYQGSSYYTIKYGIDEQEYVSRQYSQIDIVKTDADGTRSREYIRTPPSAVATRICTAAEAATNGIEQNGMYFVDGFPANVDAHNLASGGICYEVEEIVGSSSGSSVPVQIPVSWGELNS